MTHPLLSAAQVARAQALWTRYAADRDLEVRNELLELYLPWCREVARGLFRRRGGLVGEFGEYLQMATLAMIECMDAYDASHGPPFDAFALPRVRGKVLDQLRAQSEKHEQVSLLVRLRRQRAQSLHESGVAAPTDPFERLAYLSVGLAVGYMLEGTNLYRDERSDWSARAPYEGVDLLQRREALRQLVMNLPDQERRVLRYHYFHGLPMVEVARLLGLTRGRISQIHGQAIMRLREMSAERKIDIAL